MGWRARHTVLSLEPCGASRGWRLMGRPARGRARAERQRKHPWQQHRQQHRQTITGPRWNASFAQQHGTLDSSCEGARYVLGRRTQGQARCVARGQGTDAHYSLRGDTRHRTSFHTHERVARTRNRLTRGFYTLSLAGRSWSVPFDRVQQGTAMTRPGGSRIAPLSHPGQPLATLSLSTLRGASWLA